MHFTLCQLQCFWHCQRRLTSKENLLKPYYSKWSHKLWKNIYLAKKSVPIFQITKNDNYFLLNNEVKAENLKSHTVSFALCLFASLLSFTTEHLFMHIIAIIIKESFIWIQKRNLYTKLLKIIFLMLHIFSASIFIGIDICIYI